MPAARHRLFDPLLSAELADRMIRLCEERGSYGMYSEEGTADDFGTGLPQRYDAALNFVKSGGRFGRKEDPAVLAARTNYFRETYAYGDDVSLPGIEPFRDHPGFHDAAREIHGAEIVRPAIVYANILVPGQELAVHTDVPEFRGMSRMTDPQWLLVGMHHSGLFEPWRMKIATAVAYFHQCEGGGEFAFYPDGRDGDPVALPVRHNTAVVLDTDSVFHGVDRVAENATPIPRLKRSMQLRYRGPEGWAIEGEGKTVATYEWPELRFSVSWKAYCFADANEERLADEHDDDLTRERAVEMLVEDLRRRGRISERPDNAALGLAIIQEYIRFPEARAA